MELLFPLLIVALLVPMFLGMRRQRKEVAKQSQMQDSLKVGDHVVTTSGLYGTIVAVDPTTVDLEIAEDVVTTWLRAGIREVRADVDDLDATQAEPTLGQLDSPDPTDRDALPGDPRRSVEESADDTEKRLNRE
ncbi:MAG TPA: preprotein translocase subunit YajC [Aldersonia sp.]